MTAPQTVRTRRQRRLEERETRRSAPRRRPIAGRRFGLGTLSLVAVVGGLAVVGLAIALGRVPASSSAPTSVAVLRAPAGVPSAALVLGRADAAVTIDLYEDFQCPACEAWGRGVFPRLAANELADGSAKIVFHPLAFIGPESVAAAKAAYAAAEQDRFWDMWASLYANQGRENGGAFSRDRLVAIATEIGLDVARFETDMDSRAAADALAESIAIAGSLGITSTPTLVIAGKAHTGVGTYTDLAATIAAAGPTE